MSILLRVKVSDLVATKRVLFDVPASTSIGDTLAALEIEHILSVPVFGTPGSWAGAGGAELIINGKQYIGIVSVLDLVSSILQNAPYFDQGSVQNALTRPVSSVIGATDESLSLWIETSDKPLVRSNVFKRSLAVILVV
jgi:hypothetical protein